MSVLPDIPKAEKTIDARGSFCPGPLLELIRGVKSVSVGAIVVVLSSDPGSNKDIPLWTRKAGHEYLGAFPEAGYTRFAVRKAH
ncbi:MAG TPA: sulfurtransferase TusA family protein [Roseiflexaceae bacterium]|nr:sulfurtransferase TusA family protein [Roseiflexaceae bacterium]